MRLLPTAVTSVLSGAAIAALALSIASGPVQAAAYREPLTKDATAVVGSGLNPDNYSLIKLDITPLKGETVKRYGHEVAAVYDVKVVYKKRVLFERHLGYSRTIAVKSKLGQHGDFKSAAGFVKVARAASHLSAQQAQQVVKGAVRAELHSQLLSDVRNTVTNVTNALAQEPGAGSSTGNSSTSAISVQKLLDENKIAIAFSGDSKGNYGYGARASVKVVPLGFSEGLYWEDYKVVGTLSDGYTYTFDSRTGTFASHTQK